MLKKIIFSSIIGLAMLAFTGCTDGNDAATGKCDSAKKVETKCDAGKCDNGKKVAPKPESKCGEGKCG